MHSFIHHSPNCTFMRFYTLFLGLLLWSAAASAQHQLEFSLGYTSSLTQYADFPIVEPGTTINTDLLAKRLPSHSFMVNGTVGYMITKHFGVITGFGVTGISQHYSLGYPSPSVDHNATFTRNMTYLRVPLLLRLQTPIGKGWTVYGQAGIHGDFLLGTSHRLEEDGNARPFNTDIEKSYNQSMWGLTAELGIMYQIAPQTSLMLGVHGTAGINYPGGDDVNFTIYGSQSPTIGFASAALQTVGLRFGIRQTIDLRPKAKQ